MQPIAKATEKTQQEQTRVVKYDLYIHQAQSAVQLSEVPRGVPAVI